MNHQGVFRSALALPESANNSITQKYGVTGISMTSTVNVQLSWISNIRATIISNDFLGPAYFNILFHDLFYSGINQFMKIFSYS